MSSTNSSSRPSQEPPREVKAFITQVQRRLVWQRLATAGVWVLAAVSTCLLLVALAYVVQGYAVDRQWYVVAACTAVAATLLAGVVRIASQETAARFADQHFDLKDTLISSLHFARDQKTGGFYALQQEQAAKQVKELEAKRIAWQPPRWPAFTGMALAAIAIALAFKSPSQAVQQRLALEDLTIEQTSLANAQLEELVRDLNEQTTDPLEREMIEPDKLREMVDSLGKTKDQKEALRQYAKLEQQLNKQLAKLQQKRDEHLMQAAAEELKKSKETKPLAKTLEQKKYDKAAKQLEDMKPEEGKQLSEQQKQLAKMQAASKRMAAAVRNQRGKNASASASKSSKQGKSANASSSAKGGKSGSAQGGNGSAGGDLGQAIEDLEESLEEWNDALAEATRQEKQNGECDSQCKSQCQSGRKKAGQCMSKLSRYMKKMACKKKACDSLSKLCKACSNCQSGLCQSQSLKNGRGIGSSSNFSERLARDEVMDNGNTESLKGIKGQGPSQTSIETAEEGTGVASRGTTKSAREYKRQFESFVSREDVPDEVRAGVKQYFQSIHQIKPTTGVNNRSAIDAPATEDGETL